MTNEYDVIIAGAGPAGTVCAMYLKKAGKKVLVIDKAKFPRDKVCGDAQGRKLAKDMKELGIYEDYKKLPGVAIYGLILSSPNGTQIDMDLIDKVKGTPGYVIKRIDIDNFLIDKENIENNTIYNVVYGIKSLGFDSTFKNNTIYFSI